MGFGNKVTYTAYIVVEIIKLAFQPVFYVCFIFLDNEHVYSPVR